MAAMFPLQCGGIPAARNTLLLLRPSKSCALLQTQFNVTFLQTHGLKPILCMMSTKQHLDHSVIFNHFMKDLAYLLVSHLIQKRIPDHSMS